MKVGAILPDSFYASWTVTLGLADTFMRLGHDVHIVKVPQNGRVDPKQLPPLEMLREFDGLFLSGPEHLAPYLDAVYGQAEWKKLPVKKVGWYHESNDRDDRHFGFEKLTGWCDTHFFPAVQDAEQLGGRWLPFGADTVVFSPQNRVKRYEVIFIGLLYEKRKQYLQQLAPKLPNVRFTLGNCSVQDLGGIQLRESAELYAKNVNQAQLFLNLPSLSRLVVTKVPEVVACGVPCLTPFPQGDAKNYENYPAFFYEPDDLDELARMIQQFIANPEKWRKQVEQMTWRMRAEYSLENLSTQLLEALA